MADAPPVPPIHIPGDLPEDHPMQELLVIRHGETEWNSRQVIQGFKDVPLSDAGLAQAAALAARLGNSRGNARLDAIYTSPLQRAAVTAAMLAAKSGSSGCKVVALDALKELNCGAFEGLSYGEVRKAHAAAYTAWMSDPDQPCPAGESFNQFKARVGEGLQTIFNARQARVLISGHSGVSRAIFAWLFGLDFRLAVRMEQRNTALTIFRWEKGACRLKLWNGTRHLDDVV